MTLSNVLACVRNLPIPSGRCQRHNRHCRSSQVARASRFLFLRSHDDPRAFGEMNDDLPYLVEYAKSDRSKCQLCKQPINKLSLRLAAVVQVRTFFRDAENRANVLCAVLCPTYFNILAINSELYNDTLCHRCCH